MSSRDISRRQVLKGITAAGAGALASRACVFGASSSDARPEGEQGPQCYLPLLRKHLTSDSLNFVVIMCDTLRYDHIGFLGNETVQTPNIDAFCSQAVVFDKAYSGGFPTLLNRAEILTGRCTYTYMAWEDLRDEEVVLAEVLNDAGYTTGLIFDTWHLRAEKFSYDRAFKSWQWIRGQENDRLGTLPLHPELPCDPSKMRHEPEVIEQYLRNVSLRQTEADYFCARTMQAAIDWLRRIYDENKFFLMIDSFDPHEPWDPPQSYVDLYDPGYVGEEVIYPAYAPSDYLSAEELLHVQALYAAEVTMVDHWLGTLFTELGNLGLWDNTVVILTSDHGILLGEHGFIGKAWDEEGHRECYPLYEELVHIPLIMRVPGVAPRRTARLAQPADLMPTIIEWAGAASPSTMHGMSLVPAIEDETGQTPTHGYAVSSRTVQASLATEPLIAVTDGQWVLNHGGGHATSTLHYLPDDPHQQADLLDQNCAKATELHAALVAHLEAVGTAEEYIAPWRIPPCT